MGKNTSINKATFTINRDEIYQTWLEFTRPMHNLTNSDIKTISELLKLRAELSKSITDEDILDSFLFSTENRKKVLNALGIQHSRFSNLIARFRKIGVMDGNKINKRYIPRASAQDGSCTIVLEFKFKEEGADE